MRDYKIFHKLKLLLLNRFKLTVSARIPQGGLAQSLKKSSELGFNGLNRHYS